MVWNGLWETVRNGEEHWPMGMVNNRERQSKNGNGKVTERYGNGNANGRKLKEKQFELNIFL